MQFDYKKIAPGVLRPIIPIELLHKGNVLRYEVLVDSGADACIFPAEIGELLGIDVASGKKDSVTGITGVPQTYYLHPLSIRIGVLAYVIEAGFLPHMADLGCGVVGQRGFFDLFRVVFDLQNERIELHPMS